MTNQIETFERINGVWRSLVYRMDSSADIAKYVARTRYAWPGGYELHAITDDGGLLCNDCCRAEFRRIAESNHGDGWHCVDFDTNWESPDDYCDHCNRQIEPAYSDD